MEKNVRKCLVIGGMTIVFWIFSLCIGGIVKDRTILSDETQKEVAKSWSEKQDFVGPILCVPVYNDSASIPYTCMYVLPERLEADADIQSETLHRGIFDASVYRTKISLAGTFNLKEMKFTEKLPEKKKPVRFDWEHAQVVTAVGDKRGLEEGIQFSIDDQKYAIDQRFNYYGCRNLCAIFNNSHDVICRMADLSQMVGKEVNFSLEADLKGSDGLNVAPIGRNSKITIHGNSQDPSFDGMVLPSSREVTDAGFTATWKINSMNRNDVDQVFYSFDDYKNFQSVGTKILVTGGQYTKTDRALKYAFLVILLSLVAVLVGELSVKNEINELNYLLIGAALVLFYLMLLSFGEWMGFGVAYGLSALLILGMITLYLKAIVGKSNTALAVCLFMTLIDVFIYILLGIADMALLVGTLGLFVMLGVAMFFSLRMTVANSKEIA